MGLRVWFRYTVRARYHRKRAERFYRDATAAWKPSARNLYFRLATNETTLAEKAECLAKSRRSDRIRDANSHLVSAAGYPV
jgi:hypothetical protein